MADRKRREVAWRETRRGIGGIKREVEVGRKENGVKMWKKRREGEKYTFCPGPEQLKGGERGEGKHSPNWGGKKI